MRPPQLPSDDFDFDKTFSKVFKVGLTAGIIYVSLILLGLAALVVILFRVAF